MKLHLDRLNGSQYNLRCLLGGQIIREMMGWIRQQAAMPVLIWLFAFLGQDNKSSEDLPSQWRGRERCRVRSGYGKPERIIFYGGLSNGFSYKQSKAHVLQISDRYIW